MIIREWINESKHMTKRHGFITGCLVGLFVFLVVCGYRILNPLYTDWLLGKSDFSMPYFGLRFFLRSNNTSFNLIQGMTYPYSVSPIFLDLVIPVSCFLKLFDFILPQDIQIQGIVTLSYFILQGGFTGLIIRKFVKNRCIIIIAAVILCLSPWFLIRLFYHYTLGAQWLLLAGLCIWAYSDELGDKSYYLWCALVPLSSMIHLYYVPMLIGIMFFSYLGNLFSSKELVKPIIFECIAGILSVFLVYILNGFSSTVAVPDPTYERLGHVNMNLNAFYNSLGYSSFIQGFPHPEGYPYQGLEGYAYLGLGIMLLIIFDFVLIIWKREYVVKRVKDNKNQVIPIMLCVILFILISVGFCITYSDTIIMELELPGILRPIVATFRAIGRYIWVPCYIIIISSIVIFDKLTRIAITKNHYILIIIMSIVAAIQVVDIKPLIAEKHQYADSQIIHESFMKDLKWKVLADNHKYVVAMKDYDFALNNMYTNDINRYVLDNDLCITVSQIAHYGSIFFEDEKKRMEEIINGNADSDAIYLFSNDNEFFEAANYIHCEIIDGYKVGWVE